jgi:DNA repair photolyase
MAPILPLLTDTEECVRQLIGEAAPHKPEFIMPSYLRLGTRDVKAWFFQTLQLRYPHLTGKYAKLYAGSAYLPAGYREQGYRMIDAVLHEYGLTRQAPVAGRNNDESEAPVQLSFTF